MSWATLVGAGTLVADDQLVRQRRHYGVHWEMPSGYYEPGESLEETAAREVMEEAAVAVEVGPLLCTMVWERESDRRRNVLAYFLADVAGEAEPRPQLEEDIDQAAFLDLAKLEDLHPLHRPIIDRWLAGQRDFHLCVDVLVRPDGAQDYRFRP